MLAQAGRLPESLALFEETERLFEIAGFPLGELHAEAADAMLDLRLLPEARVAADRALREFMEADVPLMRAEAQLRVARVALLAGDVAAATAESRRAVEAFRQQRRTGWAARSAVVGVEARIGAGTATHADLLEVRRAAATLERLGLTVLAVDAHLTAGRTATVVGRDAGRRRASGVPTSWPAAPRADPAEGPTRRRLRRDPRGEPVEAVRHCRQGLADLDRHRGQLASTELRVLASAHGVELGQLALRELRGTSSPVKVFDWMERNRATALLSVQRAGVNGFVEEFEQLREMTGDIGAGVGESAALVARHAALEQRLRRLTWATPGEADGRTRRIPTRDLQALLEDRVLVEYGVLDGEVLAAVVTGTRVEVVDVAPVVDVRQELDPLGFLLRTLLRRAGQPTGAKLVPLARERVDRLRRILVEPLGLPPDQDLVVVPVDVLQSVPWSALVDVPVSLSPSASFWANALQRARPASRKVSGRRTRAVGGRGRGSAPEPGARAQRGAEPAGEHGPESRRGAGGR